MSKTASSLVETQLQRRKACPQNHMYQCTVGVQTVSLSQRTQCQTESTYLQLTQPTPLAKSGNQQAHH